MGRCIKNSHPQQGDQGFVVFKITYKNPLHPDDPSEEGPWRSLAAACARADSVVEEYLAVLHNEDETLFSLLHRYSESGEQPLVLEVSSEVCVYAPNILKQAEGWITGESQKRWVPPPP